MEQTKIISDRLWTQRGKVIVTKNLKRWRKSPGLATVLHELSRCVVEQDLDGGVTYDVQLYKDVRTYLLSEQFAMTGDPYVTKSSTGKEQFCENDQQFSDHRHDTVRF